MLKIGILTFQNACNYGAVLQAYALKTFINQNDKIVVEVINYKNQQIEKEKSLWSNLFKNNPIKEIIRNTLLAPYVKKRNHLFDEFCSEYLKLSQEIKKEQLRSLDYDLYIVGSDQVWNKNLTGNDKTFFCDFCSKDIPCYSYAASIGNSEFSTKGLAELTELLRGFSSISFRERELVPLFKQHIPDKNIVACIDPVYLLDKKAWSKICIEIHKKPYLLIFCVGSNPELMRTIEFAKQLARSKGLEVIYMSNQDIWYKHRELNHCGAISPGEFLSYIMNAEFVVTNSFHATSFSIIFHTPFFSEVGFSRNGRLINILDLAGLNDRTLDKGTVKAAYMQDIDWNSVDENIDKERKYSIEYLNKIVQNNE